MVALPSHVAAQVADLRHAHTTALERGRPVESVQFLERAFILLRDVLGVEHESVSSACVELVGTLNSIAMGCLRMEHFTEALDLLRRAEILTEPTSYISSKEERLRVRTSIFSG